MDPVVLPVRSVPRPAPVELIVNQEESEKESGIIETFSRSLNVHFFAYLGAAFLAGVLFVPQVRGFFLQAGLRWAHILCMSFALSFSLNPVFGGIARKLNILDMPDDRKLHTEATPLLGGAAVFTGDIGEAPDIAQPHRAARGRHHEPEAGREFTPG